ncbi:UNVERIFIED_CONTAM: hypothetical protein PYX00_003876 [Menopon gallinae]|uniref:Acyltransferase 3 domain-containing protein n=1 Tax=Menopon gallinae TaxID=328185 RepID=A0AAW2I1Z8_9NEOP
MITMPFVDNRKFRMIVERDFLFQSISNGAFSVDTFFFISGLLISYVYYKAEGGKMNRAEETAASHAKASGMKFLGGVTYRIVRLTPPYLVVLVLTYLTGRWFYFNSVFESPVGDHFTCPRYWWRNVLYINTLFPVNQMCMIWSWYLADDTQFYFLGLMILLISSRYAKFATFFTGILLASSWVTTAIITLYTQHKPSIEEPLGLFDQLYDKPWTRLGPYIVGMAVGYYLARINCKATYHKGVVTLGWILSMMTTFILVHGLYGELDQVESAAYVALSHTAWSLAVSWIVVACVTGYGGPVNVILSSRLFAPFSRLSYCAYLIHPLIMLSTLAHMDGATHLQRDTMVIAIFGYFFVSYLGSVILTILFEAPAVALLNIFHPLKKKMK